MNDQSRPENRSCARARNLAAIELATSAKVLALSLEIGSVLCAAMLRRLWSFSKLSTSSGVKKLTLFRYLITPRAPRSFGRYAFLSTLEPAIRIADSKSFQASMTTPVGFAAKAMLSSGRSSVNCIGSLAWFGREDSDPAARAGTSDESDTATASGFSVVVATSSTRRSNSAERPPGRLSLSSAGMRSVRALRKRKTIHTAAIGHASALAILATNCIQFIWFSIVTNSQ